MPTIQNKVGRLHIRRSAGESLIIGEGPTAVVITIERITTGFVDIKAVADTSVSIDRLERRELSLCKSVS